MYKLTAIITLCLLAACGHRGDLKRPSQIEQERIKKEQKQEQPTLIPELRPNANGSF